MNTRGSRLPVRNISTHSINNRFHFFNDCCTAPLAYRRTISPQFSNQLEYCSQLLDFNSSAPVGNRNISFSKSDISAPVGNRNISFNKFDFS